MRPDQRHRQPAAAEDRRAVPRHGGQDRRVRRVRLAAARPRRPGAHLASSATASGSARSRTSSTSATSSRSRSPRSTTAARSAWSRSGRRRGRARRAGQPAGAGRADARASSRTAPATRPASTAAPGTAAVARRRGASGRDACCPGGLRVVTEHVPGGPLRRGRASGSPWARGTRRRRRHGASHFLEHLLFKGTRRRSALDDRGRRSTPSAATSTRSPRKEHTCYYAHVLDARPAAGGRRGLRRGARRRHGAAGRRGRARA